jgi:heptosyltransferase III
VPEAAPQRILVITLRRLGDVLLTTPLVRSLRAAYPAAAIDMLVFAGSDGILAGNPDIANVITIPERLPVGEFFPLARSLWRRYDLALTTQGGDRPAGFAIIAGRRRAGILNNRTLLDRIKRWFFHYRAPHNPARHRVDETLQLADALGIPRRTDIVCPSGANAGLVERPYAVLHANPKYPFRRWNKPAWRQLAETLKARGLSVVVTGGDGDDERTYLDELWRGSPVIRLDGRLDWPGLTALLHEASVYVGPDTSVTHLAAGAGCPTVAIYGPASPSIIGPWPVGGMSETWKPADTLQHKSNIWLVQNPAACPWAILPCERLGCDNHYQSRSICLDEMAAEQVLAAVEAALTAPAAVS